MTLAKAPFRVWGHSLARQNTRSIWVCLELLALPFLSREKVEINLKYSFARINYPAHNFYRCIPHAYFSETKPVTMHPESTETKNAYDTIAEFFSARSITDAQQYLYKFLKAAMDRKPLKANPSNVLYFYKTLDSLVGACLHIHQNEAFRKEAIIELKEKLPDLTQTEDYIGWLCPQHPWIYIPKMLTPKQYANPYLVFKKLSEIGGAEKWKFIISNLQDYTFFNSSFSECVERYNILKLYPLLQKIIEAAHLVDVRVMQPMDGRKKQNDTITAKENTTLNNIKDFFRQHPVPEMEAYLNTTLKAYLCSSEYSSTPEERSNAIYNTDCMKNFLQQLNSSAS